MKLPYLGFSSEPSCCWDNVLLQKGNGQSPGAHAIATTSTSWDLEGLSFLNLNLLLWKMGLQSALIQRSSTQD